MADTYVNPTAGGASVGFYRGTQDRLNALTTFKDGAFYITTDTNRLYYGQSDGSLAYLNKSVTVVDVLPPAKTVPEGEFYYLSASNILAYSTGSGYVQVNYVTDTSVDSIEITDGVLDGDNNIDFSVTLSQKDEKGNIITDAITDEFSIPASVLDAVIDPKVEQVKVGIDSKVEVKNNVNVATVELKGSGADSANEAITIKGEDGITIKKDTATGADGIIINGTTYSLGNGGVEQEDKSYTAESAIVFKENEGGTVKGKVTFSSGSGNSDIVITPTATSETMGDIQIAHKNYYLKDTTPQTVNGDINGDFTGNADLSDGDTVTILKGVTVNNGHVTGVNTTTFTLPSVSGLENAVITGVAADDEGYITLTRSDGDPIQSGQDLYYTINNTPYYNQSNLTNAILDLVKTKFPVLTNALTFKGGLTGGATEGLATPISTLVSSASIGDVYIVSSGFVAVDDSYDAESIADQGDLIIANGTESSETGLITGTIEWIIVEGTEADTTYKLFADGNEIILEDSTGEKNVITVSDDDVVILSATATTIKTEDGKDVTVSTLKGSHKEVTLKTEEDTANTLTFGETFTAITGLVEDGYGHVTEYSTTDFTMPNDPTNNHYIDGDATNKKAILKNSAGTTRGSIQVVSGNKINVAYGNTDNTDGDAVTFTVNHTTTTRKDDEDNAEISLSNGTSFNAVTEVATDSYGHITGVTIQPYKAVDHTYSLSGATVATSSNTVTVTDTLKDQIGSTTTSVFKLSAAQDSNIQLSNSGNQITMALTWGSF